MTSEVKFTTSVHGRRLRSQQGRPWRLGHQSITVGAGFNLAGPEILRSALSHWKPFGFIWTIKSILDDPFTARGKHDNSAPACQNARLMCFLTGILLPDMLTQPHLSFQQHPQDSDLTMSDEDTYRLRDKNIKCNHKVIQSTSFQLGRSQNEPLGTLHAIWIKELGFPHDNYWGKQNSCSKPPISQSYHPKKKHEILYPYPYQSYHPISP